MKIAILAPSPVPFVLGGAENLWTTWVNYLNNHTHHIADLIKLPSPEGDFWQIIDSYRAFSQLNLDHFDAVIVTKYPAWMIHHRRKIVYLQHKLRGLYDTYPPTLTTQLPAEPLLNDLKQLLSISQPTYAQLPTLWELLTALRAEQHRLPEAYFALPGPLIRALVHFMDTIALAPNQVASYATLSRTVVQRQDYFPPGVPVHLLPHPSGLVTCPPIAYQSIFTASRHDAAKRLDLLIRAYRQTQVTNPLIIAGEGPQTAQLKQLAQGDDRIQFVGRLTPQALATAYAQALFVPFIPYQEDLGLITLEALSAKKAVLTTTDSGGVAEMVQHQHTGLIVEANEQALAQAITQLCAHPEHTQKMGEQGPKSIAHISWQSLTQALIDSVENPPSILVLNTFSIYPPVGGGQQRIFQLYRHLAQCMPVTHLALVPALGDVGSISLAPQFTEERIARSLYHQVQERDLSDQLAASVGDLTAILYAHANPLYTQRLQQLLSTHPVVVVSHPYCFPMLRQVYQGPFIYEAHNVEADLKHSILGHSPEHWQLIVDTERACAQQASLVVACSEQDAQRLVELYQLNANKVVVVANGADTSQIQPATPAQKQQARQALGIPPQTLVAIFMGSYHGPNNEALEHIINLAQASPAVTFIVLGSVARHAELAMLPLPSNLHLVGVVSESHKARYLAASDVALNPITSGSGTNLKLLEYAAAGLHIVSTPFGGRGGLLRESTDYVAMNVADMAGYLTQLAKLTPAKRPSYGQSARQRVMAVADWQLLAHTYAQHLSKHRSLVV